MLGVRSACPGASRRGAAARGASEAARGASEAARGAEEAARGAEEARGDVESWDGEGGLLGVSEKAMSSCSSTGSRTANLCTPIVMLSGSLARYCGPVSALWRGLKLTAQVRTTPWVSGVTEVILQSL